MVLCTVHSNLLAVHFPYSSYICFPTHFKYLRFRVHCYTSKCGKRYYFRIEMGNGSKTIFSWMWLCYYMEATNRLICLNLAKQHAVIVNSKKIKYNKIHHTETPIGLLSVESCVRFDRVFV